MNWEKVKRFIADHKQYVLAGLLIGGIFLWFGFDNKEDNGGSLVAETQQDAETKKSAAAKPQEKGAAADKTARPKAEDVTCDVAGAVKHQGVYTLKSGARLQQLIDAAGGTTSRANLKNVNRALILRDQDKVHIPNAGEKVKASEVVISVGGPSASGETTASGGETEEPAGGKVNINTASTQELQKLNGIGEKKAAQIVAYRQKNGEFKNIADLKQVSGIGDKTFAALKDQLDV